MGHYLPDSVTALKGVVSFMEQNTLFSKSNAKYILNEMAGVEISASQRILNKAHAHSQLQASCRHTPGLSKLFTEKYVCMYVCLSFRDHVSKPLTDESSPYTGTRNKG